MDLLGDTPVLSLLDESWRIYSRHEAEPPQYVGENATVVNSTVTAGCDIRGTVKNSVLSAGVTVEEGALVEDSVLMAGVTVRRGARVTYSILDEGVEIGADATVGASRNETTEIAVIGADVKIAAGATVAPGAMLSED